MKRLERIKWIIPLALLVVIGIVSAVYINMATASDAGTEEEAEVEPCPQRPLYHVGGIVTDLKRTTEMDPTRYIRVDIKIECNDEETYSFIENNTSRVHNEIISVMRSFAAYELSGESGMERLRHSIMDRLDRLLGQGSITEIYYIEFVIQ